MHSLLYIEIYKKKPPQSTHHHTASFKVTMGGINIRGNVMIILYSLCAWFSRLRAHAYFVLYLYSCGGGKSSKQPKSIRQCFENVYKRQYNNIFREHSRCVKNNDQRNGVE